MCVMRKLKIYFLSKFQVCNTRLQTIVMMLYIRCPELVHLIMECVYSLINSAPSPLTLPSLVTTVPPSVSLNLTYFLFLSDSTYKGDHPVCFCLLILLSIMSLDSSMSLQSSLLFMPEWYSILSPCHVTSSSVHALMDT